MQIQQQSLREGQGWGELQGVHDSKASKKAELPSLQPGALLVTSLCYQPTFATLAFVSQAWPLRYSLLYGSSLPQALVSNTSNTALVKGICLRGPSVKSLSEDAHLGLKGCNSSSRQSFP